MNKKNIFLSILLLVFLIGGSNLAWASHDTVAKPSFLAGLWSNFKGKATLLFKSFYNPSGAPVVQVKVPTGQTMTNVAKTGQNQGPLFIFGQFGFGGTGGLIANPPFGKPAGYGDKDKSVNLSDIGNPQVPSEKDITPTPNKGYPTVLPPTPYPKDILDKATVLNPKEQLNPVQSPAPPAKPVYEQPTVVPAPIPKPPVKPVPPQTSATPVSSAQVVSLEVTSNQSLENIVEGASIKFRALLKMRDGIVRDISNVVAWTVLGDIGSILPGGYFTARLGPTVSEYGEGAGSIVATFKSEEGEVYVANRMIKVSAGEFQRGGDIGGQ